MDNLDNATRKDPVYLYKIVRSDNKTPSLSRFKEFIVVKAWLSKSQPDDLDHVYLDYYYNGRVHRKLKADAWAAIPCTDSKNFNIWFPYRRDEEALAECKKWLNDISREAKQDLNKRANRLIANREFGSMLHITKKDGCYEQEL